LIDSDASGSNKGLDLEKKMSKFRNIKIPDSVEKRLLAAILKMATFRNIYTGRFYI